MSELIGLDRVLMDRQREIIIEQREKITALEALLAAEKQDAAHWHILLKRLDELEPGQIISVGRPPGESTYDEDKDEYYEVPAADDKYWAQLTSEDSDGNVDCPMHGEGETPLAALIDAELLPPGEEEGEG